MLSVRLISSVVFPFHLPFYHYLVPLLIRDFSIRVTEYLHAQTDYRLRAACR
jgi:hypothetical protein